MVLRQPHSTFAMPDGQSPMAYQPWGWGEHNWGGLVTKAGGADGTGPHHVHGAVPSLFTLISAWQSAASKTVHREAAPAAAALHSTGRGLQVHVDCGVVGWQLICTAPT